MFTEVSKSVVDKVIKPGRDSRDNMGWVEAQLKGEDQPSTVHSASTRAAFLNLGVIGIGHCIILCCTFFVVL